MAKKEIESFKDYDLQDWGTVTAALCLLGIMVGLNCLFVALVFMFITSTEQDGLTGLLILIGIYTLGFGTGHLFENLKTSWKILKKERQQTSRANNSSES